jgi:hypothetical protein
MSHLNNSGFCEYIFLNGDKKGTICKKSLCKIHDEYDCNLAMYLNLNRYIYPSKKISKTSYFIFIKNLKYLNNGANEEETMNFIKLLMEFIYHNEHKGNSLAELLFIYLFKCIDTSSGYKYMLSNNKFKTTLYKKINDLCENVNASKVFKKYMLNNFIIGKRFLSIQKNNEYKTRIFRLYMKTLVFVNKWYKNIIETRYAPGGNGVIEAHKNFLISVAKISDL